MTCRHKSTSWTSARVRVCVCPTISFSYQSSIRSSVCSPPHHHQHGSARIHVRYCFTIHSSPSFSWFSSQRNDKSPCSISCLWWQPHTLFIWSAVVCPADAVFTHCSATVYLIETSRVRRTRPIMALCSFDLRSARFSSPR